MVLPVDNEYKDTAKRKVHIKSIWHAYDCEQMQGKLDSQLAVLHAISTLAFALGMLEHPQVHHCLHPHTCNCMSGMHRKVCQLLIFHVS